MNSGPSLFVYYKINIWNIWCNAKCPICIDRKKNNINENIIKKSLYKILLKIIKEKTKYKKVQILWWEPMLIFNDIEKIIKIWTKYWIKFDFPTNASLLTINKIEKLISAWLDNFTFSIDFPDNHHNKWRVLNSAFEKIIEFTKYLKEKNIEVIWNTVIWKFNYKKILEFEKLYKSIYPNIHNFIYIEDNWGLSIKNMLDKNERNETLNYLNIIKNNNYIKFAFNWFEQQNKKIKKCYIPIKNKEYYIGKNGGIIIYPCYARINIKINNFEDFKKNAINNWCNMCNFSFKDNFNYYMENLINKNISNKKKSIN